MSSHNVLPSDRERKQNTSLDVVQATALYNTILPVPKQLHNLHCYWWKGKIHPDASIQKEIVNLIQMYINQKYLLISIYIYFFNSSFNHDESKN